MVNPLSKRFTRMLVMGMTLGRRRHPAWIATSLKPDGLPARLPVELWQTPESTLRL
jgi:hypothetical protein